MSALFVEIKAIFWLVMGFDVEIVMFCHLKSCTESNCLQKQNHGFSKLENVITSQNLGQKIIHKVGIG